MNNIYTERGRFFFHQLNTYHNICPVPGRYCDCRDNGKCLMVFDDFLADEEMIVGCFNEDILEGGR